MKVHANAALGPAGRLALCDAIESGMTLRAAAALNVAPATAHRWWHRRQRQAPISGARALGSVIAPPARVVILAASRRSKSSGFARPPRDCPRARPSRRDLSPPALDDLEGPASKRDLPAAPAAPAAGASLWVVAPRSPDSRRHGSARRLCHARPPGHGSIDRRLSGSWGARFLYLHVAVDDHPRLAYVEQHPDQRQQTVVRFMRRARPTSSRSGSGRRRRS